ncbi:efflux RND transporter periplasmic adaptor subunit [Parasulfuritortus cantonensis]|uniref:Efflux RND transporter periplasmic adaptor subunit n=1 Tax=Parasulfuritortus cantonensis TaxID=2528202 RepID=A0A4R1BCI6_9PROT|nr:efflux RND transporter periplasmic adaptor subunit [Parasulfuritortus cantonensis]TCJ14759.1 efflux RND transporter periplasmic adaptor subunit [Parasulfuritortus cantonensis]
MNNTLKLVAALVAGSALGGGAVWYGLGHRPAATVAMPAMPAGPAPAKKVLYWYDPMVPDQHFDKPGKSPFMDMDLVPKYAEEDGGAGIKIDPRTLQNLGVRTAEAMVGKLWRRIDTVGYVRADDNRIEFLQARTMGWIEGLHVHAVNDPIRKGELVAEIYSPDLYAAQEEYILALQHPEDAAWVEAARRKLGFLGLSARQIDALAKGGQAQRRVNYYAPAGGIVSNIRVHPGAEVTAGTPILEITNLDRVWVTAEIVEDQAAWVVPGKSAEITLAALPGETFEGKVDYIYPKLDSATRTVQARIVLDNPGLKLKPGMYANVTLYAGKGEEGVIVPSEAVIQTGKRAVVLVAQGEGRFAPVQVETGMENGGRTVVVKGLSGGERVVTSGQFLIESEANLKGALDRLQPPGGDVYTGTAHIVAADAGTGALTMQHEPIPALKWPAMTMAFDVGDKAILEGLKKGEAVEFDLVKQGGGFVVTAIRPKP